MPTFSFVEFMREGGWGMWPVLILGLVGLATSVRYAVRPERYCLRFIAVLWVTLVVAVTHATVTRRRRRVLLPGGSGARARRADGAPAGDRPQGIVAPGRAGRHLPDADPAARRRGHLP